MRLLLALGVLLLSCGTVAAEDGSPLDKDIVGKLLMDAGNDADVDAQTAATQRLQAIGWERLEPHIDLRVQRHAQQRWAMHGAVFDLAEGEGIYRLALQCIRVGNQEGDDDLALTGISNLDQALRDQKRVRWRSAWWPVLLRELHDTEPIIVSHYSGPGFPSWALRDLLQEQVHGEEQALIEASQHREWRIRMMALPFLAATTTGRTPAVREALRASLRDQHARVRRAAVLGCWVGSWSELAPEVAERFGSERESGTVRKEAARLLGEWIDDGALHALPAADLEALFIRVMEGDSPEAAAAAAEQAGYLPRTEKLTRTLLKALLSGGPILRAGAAEGLLAGKDGSMLPPGVPIDVEALVRRADDPSIPVRCCAVRLLAERRRLPRALAPRLILRLQSDNARDARSAAVALASLRSRGGSFLDALRKAGPHAHREIRREFALAIEAIELSLLHVEHIERDLASEDPDARLAAVRELVRRDDRPRLRAALTHEDPLVAERAAQALAPYDAYTGAVLDTIVRTHGRKHTYRSADVLRSLESRLAPHADRLIKQLARTRLDRLFDLLGRSETLAPSVAALAWEDFKRSPRSGAARRVAERYEQLLPRVLEALVGKDEDQRRGAVLVLDHLTSFMGHPRWSLVEAVLEALPADDAIRRDVDRIMRECELGRFRPPHSVWIDMR